MSLWRTILTLGLLISLPNAGYCDIAAARSPKPKPPMVVPVKIVEGKVDSLDPDVVAKIVIPSSLLPDLQEASHASRSSNESFPIGTVIAGLALSAAAISLMLVNKKSPHWKKGAIGLIGCVVLIGIFLMADSIYPQNIPAPTADRATPQRLIVIEVQEYGHEVTLVLPSRK